MLCMKLLISEFYLTEIKKYVCNTQLTKQVSFTLKTFSMYRDGIKGLQFLWKFIK